MVIDLAFNDLTVIVIALLVGGLVKGVLGMGMPMVAVPIIAGFLGVEHAVVVMSIPGIVFNLWQMWQQRRDADEIPEMSRLVLFGIVGAICGSWILYIASERTLSMMLATWIGVYIIIRFMHPDLSLSLKVRMKSSPMVGTVAGIFQGAMGMCGPILGTYLNAIRLMPGAFVFAISTPFFVMALTQTLVYVYLGMYTKQLYIESFLAVIPGMLAMPVGAYIRSLVNRKIFDWLVLTMIAFIGLKLVWGVFVGTV